MEEGVRGIHSTVGPSCAPNPADGGGFNGVTLFIAPIYIPVSDRITDILHMKCFI